MSRTLGRPRPPSPAEATAWRGYEVSYRDGDGELHIVVENPDGVEHGVRRIEIDGREAVDGRIPLSGATGRRAVRCVIGRARP